MINILKNDKPSKPSNYFNINRDAEMKMNAQQLDGVHDVRFKAKYTPAMTDKPRKLRKERWEKVTRDRGQDVGVKGNNRYGVTDELIQFHQSPWRNQMTQYSQNEETDFEYKLGGYRKKRDRIYDKETDTEDNKANERRYKNRWDEPCEDEPIYIRYVEKRDSAMYNYYRNERRDFDDELRGCRDQRDRMCDKEIEMEDYKGNERRYKKRWDEPCEDELIYIRNDEKKDSARNNYKNERRDFDDELKACRDQRDRMCDKEIEMKDYKANERWFRQRRDKPYEDELSRRVYGEKRDSTIMYNNRNERRDFEDKLRGCRDERDRMCDKKIEMEDYKGNEKWYRPRRDELFEDELSGRRYGEKRDLAIFNNRNERRDFEDVLRGCREQRDSICNKETDMEDCKVQYVRRCRRSWDEPCEDEVSGRRYSNTRDSAMYKNRNDMLHKDTANNIRCRNEPYEDVQNGIRYSKKNGLVTCDVGSGTDESETDERKFRRRGHPGRGKFQLNRRETDCSGSGSERSRTGYRKHGRGSGEPWISLMCNNNKYGKYRQKRTKTWRAHKCPVRAAWRPVETDDETDTGSEMYDQSDSDREITYVPITDFNTKHEGLADVYERDRRNGRADRDERYGRKSEREQSTRGFQEHRDHAPKTEELLTVFDGQRDSFKAHSNKEPRSPGQDSTCPTTAVYLPFIPDEGCPSRSQKRETTAEEKAAEKEQADNLFQGNVKIHASVDHKQAKWSFSINLLE